MMGSATPTRKVTVGVLGGAVTAIAVWILGATTGVEVPPEIAVSTSTVVSFILSYFVSERDI